MKINYKDFEGINSLNEFIDSKKVFYGNENFPGSTIKIINVETISDFQPIERMSSTYKTKYLRLWFEE